MVQHTARRIEYPLVPRKYSPIPNTWIRIRRTIQRGPRRDRNRRRLGTTSELLGLRIGAGGTYGAGGTCADAIPTDKETSRERKTANACEKHCSDPYVYYCATLCGINAFGISEIAKGYSVRRTIRSSCVASVSQSRLVGRQTSEVQLCLGPIRPPDRSSRRSMKWPLAHASQIYWPPVRSAIGPRVH